MDIDPVCDVKVPAPYGHGIGVREGEPGAHEASTTKNECSTAEATSGGYGAVHHEYWTGGAEEGEGRGEEQEKGRRGTGRKWERLEEEGS